MSRFDILMCWAAAMLFGASVGLFWVEAASGPAPAPVTDLQMDLNLPPVVPEGAISVSGTTSIVGGPAPATLDVAFVRSDEGQQSAPVRLHTVLKRDGRWSFNLPNVPLTGTGTGEVRATLAAGGKTVQKFFPLTIIGGDFDVTVAPAPQTWMYENQGDQTANRHKITFTASVANDETGSTSYEYHWQGRSNSKTGKSLVLLSGGGTSDATATYAAPQTSAASSELYVVACEVCGKDATGSDTGDAVGAGTVTVRLLGDANLDDVVNALDYVVVSNNYGSTGIEGDVNGDGVVNALDYVVISNNYGRKM